MIADGFKRSTKGSWWRMVGLFFLLMGPGIITSNVDNDAGGIITYSLAGAEFGLKLVWSLIPIMIALIVIQEMCARMGVVTGKGLSDLIREKFGAKITFYLVIVMYFSQVINGMVLPFILVFMLLIINDKRLMTNHTNGPLYNIIVWITSIMLIILTLIFFIQML
jgi:Mn2+/Fe2+ NRAMP family transporter